LIISGIEPTVGIVSPRRISRAGGATAWASGADRRPEHAWFDDRGPPRTLLAFIPVADHMVLVGSAVAAMHVAVGAGAPLIEKVRFAADSPLGRPSSRYETKVRRALVQIAGTSRHS
jgi:hypothetical protein